MHCVMALAWRCIAGALRVHLTHSITTSLPCGNTMLLSSSAVFIWIKRPRAKWETNIKWIVTDQQLQTLHLGYYSKSKTSFILRHNHVTISPPRLSHLIHSCCSACSAVRRCDGSNFNSILINAWKMEKHPEVRKTREEKCIDNIYMILCSLPQAWRRKMTTLQRNLLCDRSIFHLDEPLHLRRCVSSPRHLQLQLQANANHKVLSEVVTMTNMAYYFPPIKVQQLTSWPPKLLMLKSEVSTLDLLEDLHSRKNCGNLSLIHLVALGKLLDTEFKLIAVHFVLCLLVSFSIEGRISTEQSKPVTDASGQEKPSFKSS